MEKIRTSFGQNIEQGRKVGIRENKLLKQYDSQHLLDRSLELLLLVIVTIGLDYKNGLLRFFLVVSLDNEASHIAQRDCRVSAQCVLEVLYLE